MSSVLCFLFLLLHQTTHLPTKLMAAAVIIRPTLRHHLTPSFPAAPPPQLQPSPVSLQMNRQPSGRRRWVPKASFTGKEMVKTAEEIKAELYLALQGIDRGIFGLTSGKKLEIEDMVEQLEFRNPTPNPTDYLMSKVDGCWKLIYTTVTILGSKRTKLGLRGFICLGDVYQTIDAAQEGAVNVIHFSAKGLRLLSGRLTIRASYMIASKSRVDIKLEASSIAPEQFASLFEKNYDLLIAIFNPEGWLDITYVDESMRIGRDDRGNIFVLERTTENAI